MRNIQGSCTFSASGRALFRRQSRHFVFSTCPVLANDRFTDTFKAGSVLCIAGPCSSGKTLLVLHILADILSSYGMCEQAVYLDFDLSLDLMVLKQIVGNQIAEYGLTGAALEAEVSSSFDRLVYFPVYDMHDTHHLFVALDAYFQSSDSRVLVIDSILTKSGTFEDELVAKCLQLLMRLCRDHGLLMVYTKREGGSFTLPFNVATLCPHDLLSEAHASLSRYNADLLRNILTFGLPVDWIPLGERVAKRPFNEMQSSSQLTRKRSIDSVRAFWRRKKDSFDVGCGFPHVGGGRSDNSGVMLCCLPCRRASIDGSGYIGCVYKINSPNSPTDTFTTAMHTRKCWQNARGIRRLLPVWLGIWTSEDEDDMFLADDCSEFQEVRTQDIVMSEQLMMESTENDKANAVVRPCTIHSRNLWSPLTHITMDDNTLHSLKFGLFRIGEDTALRSQLFCLHR
ncbi:hypothetical protein, conserved [Babesia bigemina]|uniref:DNA recombination and repair protein Rad51-like C-terminal domain-containing protein n=1 Tax=Babesia bigemina TaxID=5866 RepID=A0A061D5S1_BABBI|nr:hypothetical protein, conserved [Babesia bigemina]CDR95352.1 hypothetical protein, conserved [Babesia bigemina]|eukprot:XP_012767538.1 hypothetical protein, conserved [Babesia bigemina]